MPIDKKAGERGAARPGTRRAGRKRSTESHQAILDAAFAILEERGLLHASIEAIATRAGVGKQTIYRWWPSRGALVLEALRHRTDLEFPIPDTGSIETDLGRFLSALFAMLRSNIGMVMRALMAEAQLDADFQGELREAFIAKRREALARMLARAADRGEIRADVDVALAIDMVYGAMWYRLLVGHGPLDKRFAGGLVAMLLTGLRSPAPARPRKR